MKKIFFLSIVFYTSNLIAQGYYIDDVDPMSFNWNDPVYNDFFNTSCQISETKSATTARTITRWYANDALWASKSYGTSACKWGIFKDFGCYMTCLAMILTNSGDNINPWDLHNFVFGDSANFTGNCLLLRAEAVERRPNQKLKYKEEDTLNYERIKTVLKDENGYVLVKVDFGSSKCRHWILLYDWENINGQDIFYTADPNKPDDITKHDLSKYNTCVVRYYIPISKAQASMTVNNSSSKTVKVTKGSSIVLKRKLCTDCSGSWKSGSCEKVLWVLRDESGSTIETFSDADTYILPKLNEGSYYVSLAINNGNGFDAEVKKIIVEENSNPGTIGGGTGSATYTYLPFNYVGNCWYAVAMNTEFTIQDMSTTNLLNAHVWVNWDHDHGNYGNIPFNAGEQWAWTEGTESIGDCKWSEDFHDVLFKQMFPGHYMKHIYTSESIYTIKYYETFHNYYSGPWEHCEPLDDHTFVVWGGANVVDCNKSRSSSEVKTANNYDLGWGRAYFSGSFILNDLSPIPKVNSNNYNNQKLILSACKSIELQPGVSCEPTSGNYISFEVGVIEGSQSSSTKSADIPEENSLTPTLLEEIGTSDQELEVFPNPNAGTFTIKIKNGFINDVQIYDMFGKIMGDFNNSCNSNKCQISLNKASPGMYIVIVKSRDNTYKRKVIIKD